MGNFRADMLGFYDQCKDLHVEVMRAIAVGMGLDDKFFDSFVDVGDNTLRLLHYPEVKSDVFKANPNQVRAGEHSVSINPPPPPPPFLTHVALPWVCSV
jgi:isopenicillin N synthase-like dioxygenase